MHLIADSGSTKTKWMLLQNKNVMEDQTTGGLNPYFVDARTICSTIESSGLKPYLDQVTKLDFYGAGCAAVSMRNNMNDWLQDCFPKASINVNTDLLGCARALFNKQEGVAVILGTGMNSGYYDGEHIEQMVPSLGYILGDEGSGAYLGKGFVSLLLRNNLPEAVSATFYMETGTTRDEIIKNTYSGEFPNRYLASFTHFLSRQKEVPEIGSLIRSAFRILTENYIMPNRKDKNSKVGFIGSVAFHFRDELIEVLRQYSITDCIIEQSPINGLLKYHDCI